MTSVPAGAITPDDRDWTWVLERPCPECGLDTRQVAPDQVAARLRDNAVRWPDVLMLIEDDPLYPNWDQDATAEQDRYGEQDPATVSTQLLTAGEQLAARFDTVHGEQWQRPGRRSDGARFTIATFSRYLLHDPVHHLHDVTS